MQHSVVGLHDGVEMRGGEAEVQRIARLGAAQALGVVVLRDVVRVAVIVVRENAAVVHVLDGVQRNAHLSVVRHDSGGAVGVAGVAPAAAVTRLLGSMQHTAAQRSQARRYRSLVPRVCETEYGVTKSGQRRSGC